MKIISDIMSEPFKRSMKIIGVMVIFLLGGFLWLQHHVHDVLIPPHVVLPTNDKELITYNENRHSITVTTSKGTTTQYSRNPKVEIRKDGTVKIDADAWGFEVRPFLGMGYSDTRRAYTGCQLFYFHQFDASASFGWTAGNDKPALQPMLAIGYNFWSNTSINLGVNPISFILRTKPEIAVFLSVRL